METKKLKIIHFEYNDQEKPMMVYFEGVVEGKLFSATYTPAVDGVTVIAEYETYDYIDGTKYDLEFKVACDHPLFNEEEIRAKCMAILMKYVLKENNLSR